MFLSSMILESLPQSEEGFLHFCLLGKLSKIFSFGTDSFYSTFNRLEWVLDIFSFHPSYSKFISFFPNNISSNIRYLLLLSFIGVFFIFSLKCLLFCYFLFPALQWISNYLWIGLETMFLSPVFLKFLCKLKNWRANNDLIWIWLILFESVVVY